MSSQAKSWMRKARKASFARLLPLVLTLILGFMTCMDGLAQELNTLTQAQKDSGWVLLFDGKSLKGWHKKNETVTASSWVINDNAISRASGQNLYSPVVAESFELSVDWRLGDELGNSGVWMRMIESLSEDNRSGPEIQIVGKLHPNYTMDKQTVGSCYFMYHPNPAPGTWVKPAGQWNNFRVIMNGKHVEHWGNGVKMVEYEIGSADWLSRQNQAVDRIKNPRYGEVHYGNIVLTDHQTDIWYRNIRIRPLAGTQIRSVFPGFVVPPPPDTNSVRSRYRINPRARLSWDASLEAGARLLALDGRTLAYRPEGAGRTAAGGYLLQAHPGRDGASAPRLLAP